MEERRCYALDLLRYLRVSGFELSYTRVSLSSQDKGTQTSTCQEKFALQLFQKFMDLLSQGKDVASDRGDQQCALFRVQCALFRVQCII